MTRVLPQAPGAPYTEFGKECVLLFPLSVADGQVPLRSGGAARTEVPSAQGISRNWSRGASSLPSPACALLGGR
jgi:hypothetical protein